MRLNFSFLFCLSAIFVVQLALVSPSVSLACASCGSGSDDPLILWPNEQLKSYLGVSTSNRFETVDTQGRLGRESGPTSRDALTLALGKALRNDLFMTVTLPFQQNRLSGASLRSVGDPLLAVRWTWLLPDFTAPQQPQIQLMASHKFAHARSQQEVGRLDLLDAFGTGLPETKLGVDVFWGQSPIKGGFAVGALFPEERILGRNSVFAGNGLRSTATLGLSLGGYNKVLAGVVREYREERRDGGRRVAGSEVLAHSYFLTLDWTPANLQTLRFSFSDRGRILTNKNMIAASAFSVAWLSTWE
jgi:hypothetical protein